MNRKRVQRLMREHALLPPKRSEGRRRRPGSFQVTRPDELWHLDMTSVWVAEHGWCYLNAVAFSAAAVRCARPGVQSECSMNASEPGAYAS